MKLIFFDCYQTLIYKKDLDKKIQAFAANELGIELSLKIVADGLESMYERYKFSHPRFADANSRLEFYTTYNRELFQAMGQSLTHEQARKLNEELRNLPYAMYSDTLPLLQHLTEKKYTLGILSNWTETLKKVLHTLELENFFPYILSSHNAQIEKPDTRIFFKALSQVPGSDPSATYYIGDDYELDIVPAREAGLIPILVDRNQTKSNVTDCLKVTNLMELKNIL